LREPYVPGEIPRGKLLYRDLWYPHGLLASYVEAGLLRLFGKHLDVFYVFGLVMGVISALLLFQTGVLLEERAAGMAAALAFLF
jgi:energy-converting hydrogenase Eha subunit A